MNNLREDYSISARELDQLLHVTPQGMHHLIKSLDIETEMKKNKKFVLPVGVKQLLESRGYSYQKEVIAFSVVKGGVGKTSLSHSFAIRASQYGARVLVIDLDQQANITQAFGIDQDDLPTFFDVIQQNTVLEDSILPITTNLHLLPANMNMSFLDKYLQLNQENLSTVFKDHTDTALETYDYVIFDCPPAISSVTAAATLACSLIIMPVTPMKFALHGLKASFEELDNLEKKFKKKNLQKNIVFNRFDGRKSSSTEYLTQLAGSKTYNQYMMKCFIRENSELENCINQKHSVFDFTKKSNAREDLDLFTREIMKLNEKPFLQQ
jgi:chromosome partitioning protein